ncbi:MAG: hypothetical protein ABEJ86_06465 [Halococcoides sp.]
MVDPGRSPHLARAAALIASLDRSVEDLRDARERIRSADGDLQALAEATEDLDAMLDRYEDTAFGDGDFEAYLAFQEELASFVSDLDDDLPERAAFESIDERLHQRRLTDDDLADARKTLAEIADRVTVLEERSAAIDRVRRRRWAIERAVEDLRGRIETCETLLAHSDADLSADVTALARPVADYNRRIEADFETFRRTATVRRLLEWLQGVRWYPLVAYRPPPEDLIQYVDSNPVGTESLAQLRQYAEYSRSKLDHYVEDADTFKRSVATHRGYLRRIDADPLTIEWPPPPAGELRYRTRELIAVIDEFATEATLGALQRVRGLAFEADYSRRREAAVARSALDPVDRRRLQWGLVDRERVAADRARERLQASLREAPDP